MSGRKEIRLGDLCYKVCSGGTPKSTCSTYFEGGKIPWLNTKEINYNRLYTTESHITEEGLNNSSAKWIDANSVIVAMYGATAGRVAIAKVPMTTNQACCNLMIDSLKADYNYIYYYLSNSYKQLLSMANGAAQQNLNAQVIKDFVILLPDLHEQQNIASILSSLDDKIAVNKKICENLEAQAQALFKHWFVDFAPFKDGQFVESELGLIPEGWRVGKFSDIFDLGPGGTPKTSEKAYWENGTIPFFSPKDVNGVYCFETEKHITENGLNNCSSKLYEENTVFITCRGTVGKVAMTAVPMAMNQSNYAILSNKGYSKYFAYLVTVSIVKFLKFKANGAVFDAITTKDFNEQIIIPNTNIVSRFDSIIHPIFDEIHKIGFENLHLSTLRDTLLPKLMSGQIKVGDFK